MAKVLTAMSVVIPENGYILYADNNKMTAQYEHTIVLSENGKNVISQFEDY